MGLLDYRGTQKNNISCHNFEFETTRDDPIKSQALCSHVAGHVRMVYFGLIVNF